MDSSLSILIVDDEKLARGLLCSKLQSFGYSRIQEAESGAEALRLLDAHIPDVIFADIMMANTDGLELLKLIRQRQLDVIYVLVSGYEVFDYAREAIQYSVFYYLLKPTEDAELRAVLHDIEQELQKRRLAAALAAERSSQEYYGQRAFQQQYLEKLVFQPQTISGKELAQQEASMGIRFVSDSYAVILCQLIQPAKNHPFGDAPSLFFCVENIAAELLTEKGFSCHGFPTQRDYCLLCSIPQSYLPYEQHQQRLFDVFQEVERVCKTTLELSVLMSVGLSSGRDQLNTAFYAAQKSAQWRLHAMQEHKRKNLSANEKLSLTPEQEQSLFSAMDTGSKESVAAQVRALYAPFFQQLHGEKSTLDNLNLQVIMLLFKYLRRGNLDLSVLGEEFELYQEAAALTQEQELLSWMTDKAMACVPSGVQMPQMAADSHLFTSQVRSYLEETYAQQLTLVSISEHFHFSPSHFSRLFKKEFGTTFIKYLQDYRIQEAQRLLVTTDITVSAIGKHVGFHDAKHFYKVFKRSTGYQPSVYRERFQQSPAPSNSEDA